MRFLHITHSVRLEAGGPAEGLRRILAGYHKEGHTAEVLSLEHAARSPNDFPVPLHAFRSWPPNYGYSPEARIWLRGNAARFDGIIVHGLWQYQGLLALQELAGRYPFLLFTHGMLDPWFNRTYPLKHLKKLPYWMLVERRLLAAADRVLFTSMREQELAAESFPFTRFTPTVMPYGTAGPANHDLAEGTVRFRELARLAHDEPYLLYMGRLHQKKGCDLLVKAYAAVLQKHALPRLVIAGPDSLGLARALQEFTQSKGIADRVLWPGMLSGPIKWGAFAHAEAFILPSHQENFGIVVAEALSCSTPVLISDQVNIHETVARCQAGYVEPDTLAGTEGLLTRWALTSQDERAAMQARGLTCWHSYFDSAGTSRVIAGIFDSTQPLRSPTALSAALRRSPELPGAAKP